MITFIGIVAIIAGLICWVGQSLSFISPNIAVKLGVLDPEEEMDQIFYIIEAKALGLNDMLLTWTLPLSGVLMLLNHSFWPYLALVGGGIYLYFSGFIILSRIFLKKQNKKIGKPSAQKVAYIFGAIWLMSSLGMIVLAIMELTV